MGCTRQGEACLLPEVAERGKLLKGLENKYTPCSYIISNMVGNVNIFPNIVLGMLIKLNLVLLLFLKELNR